ncbi:iron chelate uptake ABC transporter family permease subunit [Corynebacterium testudinoris]|uniref:ABC-type Fe3+-siderophore transport system, permease component n=2 Tax=Corynebacterium testudinoris TaxID=136857 RepID=A0A0G3H8S7_9CORY|nr:ABC-type Fe3+-siderophore transport system, permease component [Corynebacterium testudinoris]MBX8996521.1 iron chelate uptake ABC transporter family permease subunit [Corynebacterium testudinoris]
MATLFGLLIVSLLLGARAIPLPDIFQALWHPDPADPLTAVIWDRRLPRTILAVVAGAAMGIAGALIQALTRNPLADTGVLGINSGAAFSAVLAFSLLGVTSAPGFLAFAMLGALIAGVLVYYIGRGRGVGVDPLRLVLAGVALSAILEGVGEGMALVDPQAFDRLRSWMVGNLDVGSFRPIMTVSIGLLVGILVLLPGLTSLNSLALGDDMATALGVSVRRTRVLMLLSITILAASATAAAGVMVFLGLMVPHLARWVGGSDQRSVLVLSAIIGPVVLLAADIIGRLILPGELPAGVVVAFVGAPFLIMFARRRGVITL